MITDDYVSFDTAKLLKEKGFKCDTLHYYYDKDGDLFFSALRVDACYNEIVTPTLQMAMKWLREVHHYYIQVMLDSWACGDHTGYYVVIQKTDSDFEMMLQDVRERVFYDTPEEATEDAIIYIVENLI